MAYPAYDTYNQAVAFPRTYSQYPGDYAYSEPAAGMAYSDGYATPGYATPGYAMYGPTGRPLSQYGGGGYALDDVDYYHEGRQMSGYSTPYHGRRRRASSVSHRTRLPMDSRHRWSSSLIKFKRKGGMRSGITLGEAMSSVRLSGNDSYSFYDLNVDHRGRILLQIRWTGYNSMTYEIPVDGYDGRVSLATVARRIARACVHFLQANMIPISWDRVILYHLEEHTPGVWQPVLSTS
ncbi:hypothetical protein NLI96_g9984 [Meripilus lineatus]|uniref:DUF6741 domain-containing protein n=1 Tax=Meripilus lineatus TaxID=2056292 RepID=A0AAD5UYY2_9APHY|nr:hypothetical protein NLI96_g9984 [Physisporinus lineatus]